MFIQDTLNLDIIFYSEQNQRVRSTAAQCWYTSTRGGVSAWFWRELELQETRPFKGESVCDTSSWVLTEAELWGWRWPPQQQQSGRIQTGPEETANEYLSILYTQKKVKIYKSNSKLESLGLEDEDFNHGAVSLVG